MTEPVMIKTIYLQAPPEKVWRHLTNKELLARWFHETDRDLKDKVSFQYFSFHYDKDDRKLMWGDVIEFNPPHKLVHTFTHEWLKGVITTVTWELTEVDGGTQLQMKHEGIDTFAELTGHDKGWDEHFLRLRMMLSY